jgi:hypothetical protein
MNAEHALGDAGPRFVGVCVVTNNFGRSHQGRNKESVARGEAGCGKAGPWALEEDEGSKGDGRVMFGVVKDVGDEVG